MGGVIQSAQDAAAAFAHVASNVVGQAASSAFGGPGKSSSQTLEAQVARLTKLVHILWQQAERVEQTVHFTGEGVCIKAGASQITLLKNGGILIKGQRVCLESPGDTLLISEASGQLKK